MCLDSVFSKLEMNPSDTAVCGWLQVLYFMKICKYYVTESSTVNYQM